MKYIIDDNYKINNKKAINKKKMIITIGVLILIIAIIVIASLYIANRNFREFFDVYIFRKSITENTSSYIELNTESNIYTYAYDKYIAILDKNVLGLYSSNGNKEHEIKTEISTPLFKSNNKYLAIAEKDKQKIYFISGQNIVWQKDLEGNISRIYVNQNGYTSVVLTGTIHKTVVMTFNPEGKELFKTFLAATRAVDIAISNDNKYLAIAEIDTSGTLIQSNIKIISFETAQKTPSDAIIYTYKADADELIISLKYQDNNKLICMYNDSIHSISEQKDEVLLKFSENKVNMADIKLKENFVKIVEKTTGLFSTETTAQIVNTSNKSEKTYILDSSVKNLYTNENVIAINLGSEVHFIDTNGWLIKKYVSSQEIKDIVICDNLAGIIYKDKVEFISF